MFLLLLTESSKIKGAKSCEGGSVRVNWLCISCPDFVGSRVEGISNGGHFFCISLYTTAANFAKRLERSEVV